MGVKLTDLFKPLEVLSILQSDIFIENFLSGFFKTPKQGCQTSVFLACSTELEGVTGRYFMDCTERRLSKNVTDESKAKKLWELSEKYVNLRRTDPKI